MNKSDAGVDYNRARGVFFCSLNNNVQNGRDVESD